MATSKLIQVNNNHNSDNLKLELKLINENIDLIYKYKEETIENIEEKKLLIRQKTDANNFFKVYKQCGKRFEKQKLPRLSIAKIEGVISLLDREISLIQNKHGLIYNDLKSLKQEIEDRIQTVDKTEILMRILNYKSSEIHRQFLKKIDILKSNKEKLQTGDVTVETESQMALRLVELDKDISDCENTYESLMQSVREQILEAQKQYESSINILDDSLEVMRKNFNNLLLLIEAEKLQLNESQTELITDKYLSIIDELQNDIDALTEIQTAGWKTEEHQGLTTVLIEGKGFKLTNSGFIITESGQHISFEEAQERDLIDGHIFLTDFFKTPEKKEVDVLSTHSKDESKSSDYSRMSSEDVSYLKENLGIPLTLALAEITAIQPKDPIHYLGHWLFKYRYNQEQSEIQKIEVDELNERRNRIASEAWHKFVEDEARAAVIEMIVRAEEQAIRNELRRIEMELEAMEEEEFEGNFTDEIKDKFDI